MRDELRNLRKSIPEYSPVSRMKKGDISSQIEKLKTMRAETPGVASLPSAPMKVSKSAVESIKEAKAKEFPVKPMESKKEPAKKEASKKVESGKKKTLTKSKLRQLLEEMSSDEE